MSSLLAICDTLDRAAGNGLLVVSPLDDRQDVSVPAQNTLATYSDEQ